MHSLSQPFTISSACPALWLLDSLPSLATAPPRFSGSSPAWMSNGRQSCGALTKKPRNRLHSKNLTFWPPRGFMIFRARRAPGLGTDLRYDTLCQGSLFLVIQVLTFCDESNQTRCH